MRAQSSEKPGPPLVIAIARQNRNTKKYAYAEKD